MIAMGVPLASAVVMDQMPKTGVAEVPFAFQVDAQALPPGSYMVKQADGGRSVQIQSQLMAGASVKCVAVRRKFGNAQEPRLVFENYEGRYFLSEIWFETDGRGLILRNTSLEHKDAPNAAGAIRYVRFQ
jgi:hypothetical protein